MAFVSMFCSLYYNIIVAWILHFLFASFRSKLTWHLCSNSWNDDACVNRETVFGELTKSLKNNISIVYCNKNSTKVFENCTQGVFATTQYFKYCLFSIITIKSYLFNYFDLRKHVLGMSESFEEFGTPRWPLVLCLLLAW